MQTRTFLFADLRDYTRFVEHHGDAAAATLIGDYRRLVRSEVARHGGAEVKTEGDSFYVVFDSATAALTCAMAILREAERYSMERADRPMRLGVGLHAGEPRPHDDQFVGEAVIIAARLAQQARAGELLVTDVVRGLVGRADVPAPHERTDIALKGIDDPPRIYAVDWHAPEPPPPLAKPPPASVPGRPLEGGIVAARELIDRATELAALESLWLDAAKGTGRLVLIAGEAGVGKSALLRTFLAGRAEAVLSGECAEMGMGRPFGPIIDALAGIGGVPADLQRLGPGAQSVMEVDRHVIHAAILSTLRERSVDRPIALVLEDIHWADPSTLEFLERLPKQVAAGRILVLVTYRPEEASGSRLGQALARIERSRLATGIQLHPLDEDGTARLVMSALGLDRAPTRDFRVAIHERCEGNPFFTEEVLRTLVENGEIRYEAGSWLRDRAIAELALPRTISAAVELRLRALLPTTIRVLRLAAVIGARFEFDLLAEVSGVSEGPLVAALGDAVEAQLIVEDHVNGTERYRFRHAITREAVMATILARERRALHRAAATVIERRAGGTTSPVAEDLAYHFDQAGEVDQAIRYLVRAAEHAQQTGSSSSVRRHIERAIALAPATHPDLDRMYLQLSRVAYISAEHERAEEAARAALRIAETRGRKLLAGAAHTALARVMYAVGRDTDRDAALERAMGILEPIGPTVELADAYTVRLSIAWFERWPDAVKIGRECLALAEQVGWTWGRVRSLNMLGLAMFYTGGERQEREALDLLRSGLELSRTHAFVDVFERAITNLHEALLTYGAPAEEVEPLRDSAIEHAARYGYRCEEEWHRSFDAGDWDATLDYIEELSAGTSLFAANRALHAALIRAFRDGPAIGLAAAERPCGQLLAARAPQWTNSATRRGVIRFLAHDLRGTIAEARLGLELPSESYLEDALVAAILAARELGDDASLSVLLERAEHQLERVRLGRTGDARTAAFAVVFASFANAVTAELRGDTAAALAAYALSAEAGGQWRRAFTATQARLARARLLAASDPTAAKAEIDLALPFWRTAKASWYLAQLAQTASSLGAGRAHEIRSGGT